MIATCDMNGFIKETCEMILRESGPNDEQSDRGTVDSARFELWIEEMLCPILGRYACGEPRLLVFLDKASIHHSDKVVDLIEATGARIMYTAPLSPDLNPIEFMFAEYKKGLKRYSKNRSLLEPHE